MHDSSALRCHPLTPGPKQNQLISALTGVEYECLSPHLEQVSMPLGQMLYKPGGGLSYAYFPTTAIISLHYVTTSGASAETASVGNEGMAGVTLFMGGDILPGFATVLIAGDAWRLPGRILKQEFHRGGVMHDLLLRYTQALITQMGQNVVCYRYHTVEQQLVRWLLSILDRIPSGELTITQDLIAGILGVRREGITQAVGNLQRAGFISCRRGHISVLVRAELETHACECYAVVKKERGRFMSDFKIS